MSRFDYRLFVIKPSRIVSSLCYSVLKLEPYRDCMYNCIYCYSKWHRGLLGIEPEAYIKLWIRLASELRNLDYKPYFRLSTLTDPFQESVEKSTMLSYRLIEVAYMNNIPLIINTKSKLVVEKPWINLLLDMARSNNLLVQISISTSDKYSYLFERRAPSTSSRISVIHKLIENEIPVAVRLQPVIPSLEDDQVSVLEKVVDLGVNGIISEPVRLTRSELEYVARVLKIELNSYFEKYFWRKYTEESIDYWTPGDSWWFNTLSKFREICGSKVVLTICKYKPLEFYSGDCCLFYTTNCRRFGVRETIREFFKRSQSGIHVYTLSEYSLFPRVIRKGLKQHFNKLMKVINDKLFINKYIGLDTSMS